MKRLTMIAVALLAMCSVAFAQQSKTDETLEFRPHWSLGIQGGAAHTIGEAQFAELLSPAAQLSLTYKFHHAMGVRFGLGGWQGKGQELVTPLLYKYQFGQLNADYILDLAGIFGGFNHKRVVNPYLLAGVGAAYGFNNSEAAAVQEDLEYYWESKFFVPVRFGAGVDFRLSDVVSLGLESNANVLSDKFNSKRADNADWQINLLAGLKFAFGGNTRPSAEYAAKVAAAERAAKAAENSDNVFFTINSTFIRKAEGAKLEKLAEWMKANPDFNVALVGYADKETGSAAGNMKLSENRANVVKARLVKLGVAAERISTAFKGDTVQPFAENNKNRCVICTLE